MSLIQLSSCAPRTAPCSGCSGSCSRRGFFAKLSTLLFFLSCKDGERSESLASIPVDLGPIEKYAEGVTPLPMYRVQVQRTANRLQAMSIVCTHQPCMLNAVSTGFDCPCHGSRFSSTGARISGPAPRGLPWFRLSADAREVASASRC